jgi:hypothetical protein
MGDLPHRPPLARAKIKPPATTVMETTKVTWWEAEIHRTAGEIALMPSEPDAAKAEAYFDRALAVARCGEGNTSVVL